MLVNLASAVNPCNERLNSGGTQMIENAILETELESRDPLLFSILNWHGTLK